MSYTKVKNMSLKKDGVITITAASSNVYPTRYDTEELFVNTDYTISKKLRIIFDDLWGGNLVFNQSSKSKIYYAYLRSLEHFHANYDFHRQRLWQITDEDKKVVSPEKAREINNELYFVFTRALMEPIAMTKKEYANKKEDGYWVAEVRKHAHYINRYEPKFFVINRALLNKLKYGGSIVTKEEFENSK